MFTFALRELTLGPGDDRRFELVEEALDVNPGSYEMEVTVTGAPAPPPVIRAVTVDRAVAES